MIALFIALLMAETPRAELSKSEMARNVLSYEIDRAAMEFDIDPVLLTLWAYLESSFDQSSRGKLGEIGLMQVHGQSRKICESAGLDVMKRSDNIECGALLMDMNRRYCGSMYRGLLRYASGRCEGTPRARRKVSWRLRELDRWKRRLQYAFSQL
jgi:soluble lytic murein transglycosylase-like protein